MPGEYGDIQLTLDVRRLGLVLEKIGGKGGPGDQIGSRGCHGHIGQIRCPLPRQFQAIRRREWALFLRQDKKIHPVAGSCRRLNEPAVAPGEGIAVHHRRAHHTGAAGRLQAFQKGLNAVPLVLHQQDLVGPGHGIEKQGGKHGLVLGLGIQKQVPQAAGEGLLPQACQECGRQALSLPRRIHRDALEDIPLPGTRGRQFSVLPEQRRKLHRLRAVQACPGQECRPLAAPPALQIPDQFHFHGATSFCFIISGVKIHCKIENCII